MNGELITLEATQSNNNNDPKSASPSSNSQILILEPSREKAWLSSPEVCPENYIPAEERTPFRSVLVLSLNDIKYRSRVWLF